MFSLLSSSSVQGPFGKYALLNARSTGYHCNWRFQIITGCSQYCSFSLDFDVGGAGGLYLSGPGSARSLRERTLRGLYVKKEIFLLPGALQLRIYRSRFGTEFRGMMQAYQKLSEKYPSFRERSENTDLSVEISLQPYHAFKPDGVILFSDILTPLTGMNIPFDIIEKSGPIIHKPIRTAADVAQVRELVPEEAVPYVGETLRILRSEVGNASAVLGFVGAPFTLASYIVEGGSSKNYTVIKKLAFTEPQILHSLLQKLAESITIYVRYQADAGAQAVQIFDSWGTHLSPADFEVFSLPYIKYIVENVKKTHPNLPIILYASGSGGLLERMATSGVDVMSLDWSVDMAEGRKRVGKDLAVQGNMDPAALFGSKDFITRRIHETVEKAGRDKHIFNLGHGVLVGTPEENVAHFFETALNIRY